jgi:hypothetical protein
MDVSMKRAEASFVEREKKQQLTDRGSVIGKAELLTSQMLPEMVFGTDRKWKSSFGLPPVVERKRIEVIGSRKRKPVSFFDPNRDRTLVLHANQEATSGDADEPFNVDHSSNIHIDTGEQAKHGDTDRPEEKSPGEDEKEPKLFVDVNVANFGLKRIVVYEGDTVESLVADFIKNCPIDEPMIERLKELLKKQMDGVLDAIVEDDDN